METRLTSAAPNLPLVTTRPDPVPVRNAVKTDLAPPAAVSAQVGADSARSTKDQRRPGEKPVVGDRRESRIDTDRETGDLVYRVIDPETRSVVTQYPYESLLKLRAYIKHADEGHTKAE